MARKTLFSLLSTATALFAFTALTMAQDTSGQVTASTVGDITGNAARTESSCLVGCKADTKSPKVKPRSNPFT
jgi:hypothetical protein